ncbi:hypothetical protein FS749_003417 [Ceratobasidium sp. UAMH 11750]|nr:hypothetical protein FS749_003417 [Ceratobasidium sp. UAMH 11750]
MSKHNMNAGRPIIFRSYGVRANRTPDCAIWEAVSASMAHPAHFKSIDVGELRESLVTGALGCSNPTAHALEEVKRVYPDRHVSCIIVIGAGHPKTIHIPEPSPMQRMLVPTDPNAVAMSIAMDPERVAEEMAGRFRGTVDVYFRLSIEQGMQTIASDSWDELNKVIAHTRRYMWQGGVSADIDKIVMVMRERKLAVSTMQIDGQIQLPIQQIAVVKQCPDPTPLFTGRNGMIELITNSILDGDKQRCVFVLHGLGGAGKTQVALKTVQITRDMWTDIVHVDATTRGTVVSSLERFAKLKKIGDAHTDTIQWLSIRRERWLMVFDNADDPNLDVPSFFPQGDHGSILITTRNSHLSIIAQGADPECSVFSMYPGEALELLLKAARLKIEQMSEADRNIVVKLLQEFGHLALAIVHAGAYIQCSPCTVAQYYDMFRSQRLPTLKLYQNVLCNFGRHQGSVCTTWHMSYKSLKNRAQQLLWLMAFMHHDNITEELFRRAALNAQGYEFPIPPSDAETGVHAYIKDVLRAYLDPDGSWNPVAFSVVMTELSAYSLISRDQTKAAFTLHVLVHDWVSTTIPHERAVAVEHTTLLLAIACANPTKSAVEYTYKRTLEAHVSAVLQRQAEPRANNALRFAEVYHCAGKWSQKLTMDLAGLEARKRAFGDENSSTLNSRHNLAATYQHLGRYNEAKELQVQVLRTRKRISSDRHPDTLAGMENLALTYQRLGQYNEAEELQIQVFETRKELFGEQDSSTLTSMHNLALTHRHLGRYKEAEALQLRVMKARKRVSGDDHPHTLTSVRELALTHQYLGRYKAAEALQTQELKARERISGDEHTDTLTSMHNLALTWQYQGRYNEAEQLQLRELKARKRLSGDEHPDTLTSMDSLAITYRHQGRYDEAEALQAKVLEARKRISSDEHPDTLTIMHNLAATYQLQGRYEAAEGLQRQVLEARRQRSGDKHPDTLTSMHNLALTYQYQGRYEEAAQLQEQELEACRQVFSDEHPDTLVSMRCLALTYQYLHRHEEARALQVQELQIREQTFSEEHPDTLTSMENLATTYHYLGRYEEAEALRVQELDARKRVSRDEDPSMLTSMHNLAAAYQYTGKLNKAETLLIEVVDRRKRVLTPTHPDTLKSMKRLVNVYQSFGFQRQNERDTLEAELHGLGFS